MGLCRTRAERVPHILLHKLFGGWKIIVRKIYETRTEVALGSHAHSKVLPDEGIGATQFGSASEKRELACELRSRQCYILK